MPKRTIPSRTSTGNVRTIGAPSAHGLVTVPDSRQILQLCKGQVTVVPPTIPSANGPPLCGQRFSIARNPCFVLNTASERLPARTARPSRGGIFSAAVTRIHCMRSLHFLYAHWANFDKLRGTRPVPLEPRVIRFV